MKVAIAGAGAMGCMLGYFLSKGGTEVSLIVRREELKNAIENRGISFRPYGAEIEEKIAEDESIKMKAVLNTSNLVEELKDTDAVIITTKSTETENILKDIRSVIGKNTKVITLQNGLGNVDIIKKYVKEENIFYGCMNMSCTMVRPAVLEGSLFDGVCIYIGSVVNEKHQRKFGIELAEAFSKGGLSCEYTDDIDKEVWSKLLVNIAVNATCGLVRLRGGEAGVDSDFISVSIDMIKEAIAVASKMGVEIDFNTFMGVTLPKASKTSGAHYPSMAQDMMIHKSRTEIDFINGAISRLGEKYGVPVPVNTTVSRLVRTYQNNYVKQYYPKSSSSKSAFNVEVEPKFCKGCGYCVKYCAAKVFEIKNREAVVKDAGKCVGCMNCVFVCPEGAVSIEKL